ncbi:hypothetical protein GVX76_00735 [[Haemophilus] felis]|nr:hypothetical protein [[Haemophilus] felis]
MKNFIDITNRLKTELSISMDKEIAELLGMSKFSFAERKKRDSFPVHQLTEFVLNHPELSLDLDYILGNVKAPKDKKQGEIVVNPSAVEEFDEEMDVDSLTPKEVLLIKYYRKSSSRGKDNLLRTAHMEAVLSDHNL